MIDAVNDKLRIQNPCVRAGWYHDYLNESENNNIASDRAREKRGNDEFIEISWAEAIDIVSKELNRVKTNFTNKSIFAGILWLGICGKISSCSKSVTPFF